VDMSRGLAAGHTATQPAPTVTTSPPLNTLDETNCGDVERVFQNAVFKTGVFRWCIQPPGTTCNPLGIPLEIEWTR
jgi:hypothetical protein